MPMSHLGLEAMPGETLDDTMSPHGQRKRTRHEDDEKAQDRRRSRRTRVEGDSTTSRGRKRRTRDKQRDAQGRASSSSRSSRGSRGAAGSAPEGPPEPPSGLDDDSIFREALFDALSDQTGAEYWENLYGQPIHVYPRPTRVDLETGAVAPVSDQEYVAYVRRKMWEKTHEGYLESQKETAEELRRRKREDAERQEARSRQDEADERHRVEERRRAKERRRLQEEIDRSLRRAQDRRRKKSESSAFADYIARWRDWDGEQETIPWPTETGSAEGITEKSVRSFFLRGLDLKALGTKAFNAKLKEHRVRWHPDKMEQKMGGRTKVDGTIMADITMTFQVIDTLFNDTRETK